MYSYRMKVAMYPRRRAGFKIPDREWRLGEPVRGYLSIADRWITKTQTRLSASIAPDPSKVGGKDALAVIYDPQVKSLRGSVLVIAGWELIDWKNDGRQFVLQEWVCELGG